MIALILALQITYPVLARLTLGAWLHPACLLSSIWSALACATFFFAPEYFVSPAAYLVLISLQTACLVGALCGSAVAKPAAISRPPFILLGVRPIAWIAFFIGTSSLVALVHSQGISLSGLLDPGQLLDTSHDFSVARYQDGYRMPLYASVAQMFVFFGCAVTAWDFGIQKSIKRWEYVLPLMPLIGTAIVLTTRATMIFGAIIWTGGFLASKWSRVTGLSKAVVGGRLILAVVAGGGFFLVTFVTLQFLRGGELDLSRTPEVLEHIKKWPFGSIAGFSVWFDKNGVSGSASYGYYSFTGLFDLLGIRSRETGLYSDYVDLGHGQMGNVYTLFRGLIEDFGIMGSLLAMLVFGWLCSIGVSASLRGRKLGMWLLTMLYPIVLFSPFVSFYAYSGHIFAMALLLMYLRVCVRRSQRQVVA